MPDWMWVQNALMPVLGMVMGGFVLFGVFRTVNRHLDRKHELRMAGGADPNLVAEVARLRERIEALEEQQSFRLQELEERVDFAERVLARQHDGPVLGGEH